MTNQGNYCVPVLLIDQGNRLLSTPVWCVPKHCMTLHSVLHQWQFTWISSRASHDWPENVSQDKCSLRGTWAIRGISPIRSGWRFGWRFFIIISEMSTLSGLKVHHVPNLITAVSCRCPAVLWKTWINTNLWRPWLPSWGSEYPPASV